LIAGTATVAVGLALFYVMAPEEDENVPLEIACSATGCYGVARADF
jgi:hypothetical protein